MGCGASATPQEYKDVPPSALVSEAKTHKVEHRVHFEDDGKQCKDEEGPPSFGRTPTGFVEAKDLVTQENEVEEDEAESDEDEKDDDAFEAEMERRFQAGAAKNNPRSSICAEAYTVDESWQPPVYEKTPDQHQRLSDAVQGCFMFAALGPDQLPKVIDAFQEVPVEAGETVIRQGVSVGPDENGLYVLEDGRLDVFKEGFEDPVCTYTERGSYFGDLALLYNAPRAATVIAAAPSVLWCIDRTTFNTLVKDHARAVKEQRMVFLQSVELFKGRLSIDEIARVADALREHHFAENAHIIRMGEEGTEFFILEKGHAVAKKGDERVLEYSSSDYFGELALLKNVPRAADVITTEPSTILSLNREAFHRLLGPLDELLQERAHLY